MPAYTKDVNLNIFFANYNVNLNNDEMQISYLILCSK
jgi:hypothetical protein